MLLFRALCLALACLAGPALAKIEHMSTKNDKRAAIFLERFGYVQGGFYNLTITNFAVTTPTPAAADGAAVAAPAAAAPAAADSYGIIVQRTKSAAAPLSVIQRAKGHCLLTDVSEDETMWALELNKPVQTFQKTVTEDDEGFYWTYIINCNTGSKMSFDLTLTQYNPGPNYLSIGDSPLPAIYGVVTAAYVVALVIWCTVQRRESAQVMKIHHLFTLLILVKILTTFFEVFKYQYLKTHGYASFWDVMYFTFQTFKGILVFVIIALIGTGWSFLKPFLADKEKRILMIVLPLQVIANVAKIVIDESMPGTRSWFTWADILHIVDLICCCLVLFPIVWSINSLREAAAHDGKAARNMTKLQLFRKFYITAVCYIYMTRIILFVFQTTLPYKATFVGVIALEAVSLAFYSHTAYSFQPAANNAYLLIDSMDVDDELELMHVHDADP